MSILILSPEVNFNHYFREPPMSGIRTFIRDSKISFTWDYSFHED